jgi:CRP-like cAMP-binding protein
MTGAGRDRAAALPLTLAGVRDRYAALEHAPTLFTLPPPMLRALARRSRTEQLSAGSTLFQQGEVGEAMYVVSSGLCELSVASPAGFPVTVAVAGPGEGLGEEGALLGEPRAVTVRAAVDSELIMIDRDALAAVLLPDSEEAAELLRLARQRRTSSGLLAGWSAGMGSGDQAHCLAVYAPKGGSGRTTITLNLAAQLGRAHPGEVVVVDLSLPFNDVALLADLVPTNALAGLAQGRVANFEESLLSAALPHPAGFLVLPGVLHAEQADLVSAELVERAVEVLHRSFRFVLFDLAPQLTSATLAVLERADSVLLLANADLSSLKDFKEARRVLEDVLRIPRQRILVALNHRSAQGVIDRARAESTLGQPLTCEFDFEGPKLDQAAVRGEILSLIEPRGSMARASGLIASLLDPQGAPPAQPQAGRKVFGRR